MGGIIGYFPYSGDRRPLKLEVDVSLPLAISCNLQADKDEVE
jgi:hypothetical protein